MLNFNEKIMTGKIASRSNRDFYPENLQKDQTNETYLEIAMNSNPLGSFVKQFTGTVLFWQLKFHKNKLGRSIRVKYFVLKACWVSFTLEVVSNFSHQTAEYPNRSLTL